MIQVLIVDDSAFMRKAIELILEKDPELKVVGTANDGLEAIRQVEKLKPDVVTMDVEMPRMDGITAVREIMAKFPTPILMISSVTTEGAEVTFKAMEAGALDFIAKPASRVSLDIVHMEQEIRDKIKAVGSRRATLSRRSFSTRPAVVQAVKPLTFLPRPTLAAGAGTTSAPSPRTSGKPGRDLVSIGVSTGGPPAVQKVLAALPKEFPVPVLIAQHMPAAFTGPFARRLDSVCAVTVKEAESGDKLQNGWVYIAPGGRHIKVVQRGGLLVLEVVDEPKEALYKPSANVLHESAGLALGRRVLAVQLTGMGSDGLEGVRVVKEKGGRALAQSDKTCVVYGMPKAIVDAGLADEIVDIDDMAQAILNNLYR